MFFAGIFSLIGGLPAQDCRHSDGGRIEILRAAGQPGGTYALVDERRRAPTNLDEPLVPSQVRPDVARSVEAGVASRSQVVALKVGGSSPLGHPKITVVRS
jgi:hypothetical protein